MRLVNRLVILAVLLCTGMSVYGDKYVTLRHVSIDRCASAWFIKRFVDADAVFTFFNQGEEPPAGTGFGFYGAAYFNRGPDCTFTDLVKKHHRQADPALQKMNGIVNDVMSWMQGPGTTTARLNNHIADLYDLTKSDSAVFESIFPTFDLLYVKCGGKRDGYLAREMRYYDLLELQLLRRVLNDKGKQKVDQLLEPGAGAALKTSDSALRKFFGLNKETKQPSKAQVVEGCIQVFQGDVSDISPESTEWIRDVLNDGVQTQRLEELFALTNHWSADQQLDRKTFDFDKYVWTINP